MIRPPSFPDYKTFSAPRWRAWWLALLVLWGAQLAVLLVLWPEQRPRLELWLWSTVVPLLWALALSLRCLVWQISLSNHDVYWQTLDAALQRWWRKRSRSLPVEQILLLGPALEEPAQWRPLLDGTAPLPEVTALEEKGAQGLSCSLSLKASADRPQALAVHLAKLLLAEPLPAERLKGLRGLVWVGEAGRQAFVQTLAEGGVSVPETDHSLNDLDGLDHLIDDFPRLCPEEKDWLLCAGVVGTLALEPPRIAGEGGFVWRVGWQATARLQRGEYLLADKGDTPEVVGAQVQRYAGLEQAPAQYLAMDKSSMDGFVASGWSANGSLQAGYWGELRDLAPFVGMSLALLQVASSGQACGWMSQDGAQRLAMGLAVSNGNDQA